MNRVLLVAIFASAISVLPSTAIAQEHGTRTYDDYGHKDKHEWNSREDDAWKRYRDEHHVRQEHFDRLKRKQQAEYWRWRHDHPDERR
jgi:hypothetical protein